MFKAISRLAISNTQNTIGHHKKEIQRLCDLGVLQWQADSEWALPTFILPKLDNTMRVDSDIRKLNKRIVRKPFPIPKISTVLQEREGFTYATTLATSYKVFASNLQCFSIEI